jgi:hypothetical protein
MHLITEGKSHSMRSDSNQPHLIKDSDLHSSSPLAHHGGAIPIRHHSGFAMRDHETSNFRTSRYTLLHC